MLMEDLKIKLCGGVKPQKMHPEDAAYDLFLPSDVQVREGRQVIPLGFCIELKKGQTALIRPRSGFSAKGIEAVITEVVAYAERKTVCRLDADVLEGTIDPNYRGEVGVILKCDHRLYGRKAVIPAQTRIAQMLIVETPETRLVESEELSSTDRGADGYGSTGTRGKKTSKKSAK